MCIREALRFLLKSVFGASRRCVFRPPSHFLCVLRLSWGGKKPTYKIKEPWNAMKDSDFPSLFHISFFCFFFVLNSHFWDDF